MNEIRKLINSMNTDRESQISLVDGVHVGSPAFQERTALIQRFNALAASYQACESLRLHHPIITEARRELHVVGNMLWPNGDWAPYEKPKS